MFHLPLDRWIPTPNRNKQSRRFCGCPAIWRVSVICYWGSLLTNTRLCYNVGGGSVRNTELLCCHDIRGSASKHSTTMLDYAAWKFDMSCHNPDLKTARFLCISLNIILVSINFNLMNSLISLRIFPASATIYKMRTSY